MASQQQLMAMDPDEVFDMDSPALEDALTELKITVGTTWSKSRKAHELSKAIRNLNLGDQSKTPLQSQDKDDMLFKAF